MEIWTPISLATGIIALVVAAFLLFRIKALPAGNGRMTEIAGYIREGSMAFLGREFKILAVYSLVVFCVLAYFLAFSTACAFLFGAGLSLFAGFMGMQAATLANVRTAEAAKERGRGHALMVAFDGGAVMGLCVAGLGIL